MGEAQAEITGEREFDIKRINTLMNVPEGQTVTIGGKEYQGMSPEEVEAIDPFFSASNLISIAKELPVGETRAITDPNTGAEYTIEGLDQPDVNTQIFKSTNQNTGNETFTTIDKTTGKILIQAVSQGTGAQYKYSGPIRS